MKLSALTPNPGWRPFQRLNRAEYARAVHDLLGIDVDVNSFLPPDTISSGFDNIADVQNFSPTLMEGYLRAASQISRLAVGDRNASATSVASRPASRGWAPRSACTRSRSRCSLRWRAAGARPAMTATWSPWGRRSSS